MFATHVFQQVNHWLPALRRLLQGTGEPTTPAEQMIVQVGDAYFLVDGAYRMQILADQPWLPEHGVFAADAQVELRVDG